MDWLDEADAQLQQADKAEQSGNSGRARTSARRAVGIALTRLQQRIPQYSYSHDVVGQLRGLARDESVDGDVRSAAQRLQARLSPQFESPSINPIADARCIIRFVAERLAGEL